MVLELVDKRRSERRVARRVGSSPTRGTFRIMHFLIINNGTSSLEEIKRLLKENTFDVIEFNSKESIDLSKYQAVILSGGHVFYMEDHKQDFSREKDIILNSNLPIFGICFGFQLIAYVYGSELLEMNNLEKGILKITKLCTDPIFNNIENFEVYENHRRVIKKVSDELMPLAYSRDGIEIIKHKNKLIYGTQFHPEMYVEKTSGDEMFANFLKLI